MFFVCVFVIWFSCCCWCSVVLQEQHVSSHRPLLVNNEIQTLHLCRFDSKSPNHHLHAKKRCKQFAELARCERVMTIRAEFHFSWGLYFLCHAQILVGLSTPPTGKDRLRPSAPCQGCGVGVGRIFNLRSRSRGKF